MLGDRAYDEGYADGLRDGRVKAIEAVNQGVNQMLNSISWESWDQMRVSGKKEGGEDKDADNIIGAEAKIFFSSSPCLSGEGHDLFSSTGIKGLVFCSRCNMRHSPPASSLVSPEAKTFFDSISCLSSDIPHKLYEVSEGSGEFCCNLCDLIYSPFSSRSHPSTEAKPPPVDNNRLEPHFSKAPINLDEYRQHIVIQVDSACHVFPRSYFDDLIAKKEGVEDPPRDVCLLILKEWLTSLDSEVAS